MMKNLPAFLFGLLFALGLGIAGMTQPQKVVGFLDIFGNWNPSLMWVMVGAIAVHSVTYRFVIKKSSPILAATFQIPKRKDIDAKLIIGALLFGVGWGISGFCPAPAITSLVALDPNTYVFVGSMIFAMALFRVSKKPKSETVTDAN